MGDYTRYLELAERWKNGSITPAEQQELDSWYSEHQDRPVTIPESVSPSESLHEERLLTGIRARIEAGANAATTIKPIRRYKWIAAAAAVLLLAFAGVLYYSLDNTHTRVQPITSLETIRPGSNRATLTLSNGNKIELAGQQKIEDGSVIIKNDNNSLVYSKSSEVAFNTMTTPKGGTYQLRLPDGTKVWLNAASSITYPTAFTGNNRTVKLSGEAYFEVAKDKTKPFIVETKQAPVTVLGTHFNVNAYPEEDAMQTTLLEGSVKVAGTLIEPGQAWVGGDVRKVNTDAVVAWKNGLFHFEEADLKTVMKHLERWYDIDVSYEGKIPEEKFEGEIKRNLNLGQIMKLLSYMDIHYRLEGNRHLIISGK